VDQGAIWTDNVDGSGTILATSGSVNTAVLGTYVLEYRKIDIAGNVSTTITRTIQIVPVPVVTPVITTGPG
jgi:hypothetical protein